MLMVKIEMKMKLMITEMTIMILKQTIYQLKVLIAVAVVSTVIEIKSIKKDCCKKIILMKKTK